MKTVTQYHVFPNVNVTIGRERARTKLPMISFNLSEDLKTYPTPTIPNKDTSSKRYTLSNHEKNHKAKKKIKKTLSKSFLRILDPSQ